MFKILRGIIVIEVSGLSKSFGSVKALQNISFKVPKGQIVGFLGANGAGKTTTMDILCGCIGADQGYAKICDFDITDSPIEAKKKLGYLPDEPPLHNDMRVYEFLHYAAALNLVPKAEIQKRTDQMIEKLSLGEVRKRLIGNLSKGFRQRVALAQALIHDPEVLILDEPTEGLDPNQIIQIRTMIRQLAGEHTILLSSHILTEVENTCDYIIIIDKGKILQQGTCEQILRQKEAGAIYRLRVQKDGLKFVDALKGISGIANASVVADNLIEFNANDMDETIDRVVKKTVDAGVGLRELTPQSKTLEDVFHQLTH